jgi:spore germination protein YaaH
MFCKKNIVAILIFITAVFWANYSIGLVYTIKRGDSLFSLSRKFKVPMNKILKANRIRNPNKIYIGMKLIIPTYKVRKNTKQFYIYPIRKSLIKGILRDKESYILKISIRKLTTVRAIDSGRVMSINDFRKLNKIIVIKTKGEKLVGYANLIRTFIREGEYVKRGQIIGIAKDLLLMDIVFRGKRINPCGIKFSSRSF